MKDEISIQSPLEVRMDRYGFRLAAQLSQGTAEIPHDISERLRVARQQAVARRKKLQPLLVSRPVVNGSGTLALGGSEGLGLWGRMASVLPLLALLVGLVVINVVESDNRATEVAEVDSALLTDDLPPAAYVDPGFTQFLKTSSEKSE